MKNVKFNKSTEGNTFSYIDDDGNDSFFEYKPSIAGLWNDIEPKEFEVELLIHPFLNKESNVFILTASNNNVEETVGYIFPISLLDSDTFEPIRPADNNYIYIAYHVLLERLPKIKRNAGMLGDCFENNICVMVLNRRFIGGHLNITTCIHSLRELGYSYFVEDNTLAVIEGYKYDDYKLLINKKIHLSFKVPALYAEPIIDDIMRNLPKADNLVYRFILLYQVIEFLISKRMNYDIKKAIDIYQKSFNQHENDFLEDINSIRKERGIISEILNTCDIATLPCYKSFSDACEHLFDLCQYTPARNKKEDLFYAFRNQMIHSYRNMKQYKEELAHTIFHFERVVLTIIERYPF